MADDKKPYPERPQYWSNQVQRALITSEAMATLKRDAFLLVMFVAAREDMLMYKRVPKWWTQQLMDDVGFTNKATFYTARKAAVDGGWLIVNGGGKGVEGEYFTDIPVRFAGAKSYQQTKPQDVSRCEIAPRSEPTNVSHPIPSNLVTQEAEGAALPAAVAVKRSTKPKAARAAYPAHFEAVWNAYPAMRRKNKVETLKEYEAAVNRVAEADSGDISKAQGWIFERVKAFAGSFKGQHYSPEPKRWFAKDQFYDSPESWLRYGEGSSGAGTSGSTEADAAWQMLLESIKLRSIYDYEKIEADVGPRAWKAAKPIGLRRIQDSDDFERKELQKQFKQNFSKQEVAA